MTDGNFRKRYFEALGVQEDASGRGKLKGALKRAHEIRKFEIDLYWKRATYFWALEAIVFTAFGVLWHSPDTQLFAVAFAGIGVVTGCVGWLSARGSKFWQENWEKHIDLLEGEFEGDLYKTILIERKDVLVGRKGVQFSVSRLNERLNQILFLFWLVLLAVSICIVVLKTDQPLSWLVVIREWIPQSLWFVILLEIVVPIAAVVWLF